MATSSNTAAPGISDSSWLAYVIPMAAFIIFTVAEGYAPQSYYPWLYILKVCVVTLALIVCRATWRDIRPTSRVLLPAILVGLAVFAEWILLDKIIPYPHLGTRVGFDPFSAIGSPLERLLFISVRLFGLVIMVPVMEELFWRSFLLRYLTDPDFKKIPIGTFSWTAFAIVAVAFGISHTEWLVAVISACAYGLLLWKTKSLFACIVAHAVTNLALGIYILVTREWVYW